MFHVDINLVSTSDAVMDGGQFVRCPRMCIDLDKLNSVECRLLTEHRTTRFRMKKRISYIYRHSNKNFLFEYRYEHQIIVRTLAVHLLYSNKKFLDFLFESNRCTTSSNRRRRRQFEKELL